MRGRGGHEEVWEEGVQDWTGSCPAAIQNSVADGEGTLCIG